MNGCCGVGIGREGDGLFALWGGGSGLVGPVLFGEAGVAGQEEGEGDEEGGGGGVVEEGEEVGEPVGVADEGVEERDQGEDGQPGAEAGEALAGGAAGDLPEVGGGAG